MKRFKYAFALAAIGLLFIIGILTEFVKPATASLVRTGKPPAAHCYCKAILYRGDDAGPSISNPIIDFGQLKTWNTQIGHTKECEDLCSAAAAQSANFNNKTWLCQQIRRPGRHRVSAYAAVGTLNYRVAQSIYFNCSGGETTCTCPAGWASNTSNQAGGITTDGKCKRMACQANTIAPYPPDGTQIGSWGFSWGNAFYAWGTPANGGAANCVTTPWVGTDYVAPLGYGSTCRADSECLSNICYAGKTCGEPLGPTSTCTRNKECASGRCVSGTCQ